MQGKEPALTYIFIIHIIVFVIGFTHFRNLFQFHYNKLLSKLILALRCYSILCIIVTTEFIYYFREIKKTSAIIIIIFYFLRLRNKHSAQ